MLLPETLSVSDVKIAVLTEAEFDALLEYSCSFPTEEAVGKRWKRNANVYKQQACWSLHPFDGTPEPSGPDWWLGEYVLMPRRADLSNRPGPRVFGVRWSKIVVRGSRPGPG